MDCLYCWNEWSENLFLVGGGLWHFESFKAQGMHQQAIKLFKGSKMGKVECPFRRAFSTTASFGIPIKCSDSRNKMSEIGMAILYIFAIQSACTTTQHTTHLSHFKLPALFSSLVSCHILLRLKMQPSSL